MVFNIFKLTSWGVRALRRDFSGCRWGVLRPLCPASWPRVWGRERHVFSVTSGGCFPEGEDCSMWKRQLLGVRAAHPALLPGASWPNPFSPVVSWGPCLPCSCSVMLWGRVQSVPSSQLLDTRLWCSSFLLSEVQLAQGDGYEGSPARTDASDDWEAPNETEGRRSYVFGGSPQRHLTKLVRESADHVHSNVI